MLRAGGLLNQQIHRLDVRQPAQLDRRDTPPKAPKRQGRYGPTSGSRLKSHSTLALEGAFSNIFIVLTGGAFLTGMAIFLRAGDIELGFLAAAPFLTQAAQLFSPFAFRNPKGLRTRLGFTLLLSRLLWLVIIPLLLIEADWRLHALMAVVVLSSILTMAATPAWLAWMASVIPTRIRGRFFSRRNAAVAATTLACTILGSLILDWTRKVGSEAGGFAAIIAIASIGAWVGWRALLRVPDRNGGSDHGATGLRELLPPLRDKGFRRLLVVFSLWNGAIGISAAFFAPHMLINLKMSFLQIGLYSSATALIAVVSSRAWGSLVDRFGSKPVLNLSAIGIGLTPLIWLLPRSDMLWILIPEALYSGALWAGFNLAAFTLPLDRSPQKERTVYLSVFATITGAGFFIASLAAGYIAESLVDWSFEIGNQTLVNYHVLFVCSAVLRLLTAGLIAVLREPSEARLPVIVQLMGYAVLKRLSVGRQIMPFAAEAMPSEGSTNKQNASGTL